LFQAFFRFVVFHTNHVGFLFNTLTSSVLLSTFTKDDFGVLFLSTYLDRFGITESTLFHRCTMADTVSASAPVSLFEGFCWFDRFDNWFGDHGLDYFDRFLGFGCCRCFFVFFEL